MAPRDAARVASPTIAEVPGEFLAEQREKLAPGTFSKYKNIIGLLQHCLNGYACTSLSEDESALFDRLYNAKGAAHREFCEIFGPERILPEVGEFLGYFMIRKVIASKETLRMAGTVTKKLAKWMAAKGYVKAKDAEAAAERGGDAARDLPAAEDLASLLHEFSEGEDRGEEEGEIEDHFTLTRVETGKIWLEGMLGGRELGPIEVPEEISRRCRAGWSISGVVGRVGKRWRLIESWNVYPQ